MSEPTGFYNGPPARVLCTCPDTWNCPWCKYVCDNCEDRRIDSNEKMEMSGKDKENEQE